MTPLHRQPKADQAIRLSNSFWRADWPFIFYPFGPGWHIQLASQWNASSEKFAIGSSPFDHWIILVKNQKNLY
jgi:hypothetical protein